METDEKREQPETSEIDNIEIEPLPDKDLEGVAGGICSWSGCSNTN